MRTAAIFIDAGYLYSGATATVFGNVKRRRDVRLVDPEGLVALLARRATACCDGDDIRILRTYWYDGARDGLPSPEQIAFGTLPRIKLRLGRVSGGGQKGVDGLIILDLINLARNRAIDVAVVVTGDEDIREAALYAQGFGVSVLLAGFPPGGGQGQSALLMREADHVIVLDKNDIESHVALVPDRTPEVVPGSGDALPDAATRVASEQPGPVEVSAGVEAAPDAAQAEESLRTVCESVLDDPRFVAQPPVGADGARLTRRADRMLVEKLAELTATFPVDAALLARARAMCLDLWARRGS